MLMDPVPDTLSVTTSLTTPHGSRAIDAPLDNRGVQPSCEEAIAAEFHEADSDQPGYISVDELEVLADPDADDNAWQEFVASAAAADSNGDDRLSLDELTAQVCYRWHTIRWQW